MPKWNSVRVAENSAAIFETLIGNEHCLCPMGLFVYPKMRRQIKHYSANLITIHARCMPLVLSIIWYSIPSWAKGIVGYGM
ncbi:hypothetical protein BDV25DRAFT_64121 [Aspergillus avenaceus]|uniref:Uncharacterized protein n=1 Tax=Aspergillus avenaceus TaxID=36643 RepID=A0A5N6U8N4_ASPAV|nr:hypothetical protein BDV25DRAFT_64121 [Aspergillus avenaceus]